MISKTIYQTWSTQQLPNKLEKLHDKMRKKNPDYLIVLIWSFRKEVIKQELKYIKSGGNLIFLLPRFHLINKDNYKYYLNQNFKKLSYKY